MKRYFLVLSIALIATVSFPGKEMILSDYNFSKPSFKYDLDMGLVEISGLVVNDEGKLFAHNDEIGSLFELDPQNGRIRKWFWLGPDRLKGDFEGVAAAGKDFYLVTSDGILYKFYEQPDGRYAQYEKFNTGIPEGTEIEGLCYDPNSNSLLLAEKHGKNKNLRRFFPYNLKTGKLSLNARFSISLGDLKKFKVNDFSPSDMCYDPNSGHFLVLSSKDKGIVELSSSGKIMAYQELNSDFHRQPEGITILKDGTLLIADEGKGGKGTLTGYKKK